MKTILILRHGKSAWDDLSLPDFDRPLAKRGRKDAPRMGRVLALYDCVPDMILSSPAKRAKQTAKYIAEACGYKKSIRWEESFYRGSSDDLIAALKSLPDTIQRPLLIGHNPTLEETVADLLSPHKNGWYHEWAIRIPTAGLICLKVSVTAWSTFEPGDAVLQWFLIPRLVKAIE
jgi:phosphohistidine phosphatase